jgi:esterase/lipase superfamily enzyme
MPGRAKASRSARWRFSEAADTFSAPSAGEGGMPTTVYFATNRAPTGPPEDWHSYGAGIVAPSDPAAITYAEAFVDNTNLTADTAGAIIAIQNVQKGSFSSSAIADLSAPGRNLLVFIHGFDNSFENAITRAAFNREWFAQSGVAAADTTVIAFSWPSLGQLIAFPLPWEDYKKDQTMAGQSGFHLMSFFARLQPIIMQARAAGSRIFLLAHSMGNWALQAAVESWFSHGNDDALLFDAAILAAADEVYTTFDYPEPGRLSGLHRLTGRTAILFSGADQVLKVSELINLGAERLGQDGPDNRTDAARFPPAQYDMVDCTGLRDYDFGFASSHQYYRRSPAVRNAIAQVMAG